MIPDGRQAYSLFFAFCRLGFGGCRGDADQLRRGLVGRLAGASEFQDVHNPATGEVIARTPLSTAEDLDVAVRAAEAAFPAWRDTPVAARTRAMFRFRTLLEEHCEEIAQTVTREHGKTLEESRGSVRRGIESVEAACGTPSMMMGYGLENIASGIDCQVIRQPLGVCAAIAPFNFPAMVPLWFLPFAVATGNTFIVKPSEQVPLTQRMIVDLLGRCDLPPGVVNLVNGGRELVEGICDHPGIRAVSFVGSTDVARAVYRRATHAGKRVQALGGAKNFVVVMPDADFDRAMDVITESFYGCAGERCLAGSVLVPVGAAHAPARDRLAASARALRVGDGTEDGVSMGPVISARATGSACSGTSKRGSPRERSWWWTAGAIPWPTGRTASSSAPRCSTTSRPRWRSAARRSSDRWRRSRPSARWRRRSG